MVFGTDHPNGKWSSRHDVPAAHLDVSARARNPSRQDYTDAEKNAKSRMPAVPTEKRDQPADVGAVESMKTGTAADPPREKGQSQVTIEEALEGDFGASTRSIRSVDCELTMLGPRRQTLPRSSTSPSTRNSLGEVLGILWQTRLRGFLDSPTSVRRPYLRCATILTPLSDSIFWLRAGNRCQLGQRSFWPFPIQQLWSD